MPNYPPKPEEAAEDPKIDDEPGAGPVTVELLPNPLPIKPGEPKPLPPSAEPKAGAAPNAGGAPKPPGVPPKAGAPPNAVGEVPKLAAAPNAAGAPKAGLAPNPKPCCCCVLGAAD